jgi:hypothetical protein
MRRAASAVLPLSGGSLGEGLPIAGAGRPGARLVALFGAVIVAAAVTVMTAAGPIARENASRIAAGTQLPAAAWGPVSRALGRDDPAYRTVQAGPGFVALNPHQRLRAQFSPAGVSVHSGAVLLGVRLGAYGYGNTLRALEPVAPIARANRVLYRHGSLSEWYANGPAGLEQGFTLTARPAGYRAGPLTLALGLSGNARASLSRGNAITFSHGASSLSYRGLIATDARGRAVPAWLELHGRQLLLRVRDAGAQYPLLIDPFIQQAKLTASDGAAADAFGTSVAIDGDTIVAGAPSFVANTTSRGGAYVFVKPKRGWQDATETAKLTASDGAVGDGLGISVAIDGDTIVAGAPGATVNGVSQGGAVYVFLKPKGGWRSESETAKLTASESSLSASLGSAVAIRGDAVVASAPFVPLTVVNGDEGVVYVFSEPRRGWRSETETAKLTASDEATNGGLGLFSVGISGDTIVAAGGGGSVSQRNGVYVFVEPKGGWRSETETAKLTASDGNAIGSPAIDGHTIVAGGTGATVNGNPDQGAVYVFVEQKGGWRSETESAKLTASDGAPEDQLGISVAVQSDTIVAGADLANNFGPGAVYVFVKPRGGWASATQTVKLIASDSAGPDELGFSVAIMGHTIVGGAPNATLNGNSSEGAAYVFGGRDLQIAAVNRSLAPVPRARTVSQRPEWCTRYPAGHHGALAPLLRRLRSRDRPRC